MTGLAKRWIHAKGQVYAVVNEDDFATVVVLEPVDGDNRAGRRVAVSVETLEDQRGWKPAPAPFASFPVMTDRVAAMRGAERDAYYASAMKDIGRAATRSAEEFMASVMVGGFLRKLSAGFDLGAFRVPAESLYGAPPSPMFVSPQMHAQIEGLTNGPPAPVRTHVRREVFGGGQWLDYTQLADPDPFVKYARRRVILPDGNVKTWEPPAPIEQTRAFLDHARQDREIALKVANEDISRKWKRTRPNVYGNVVPTFGVDPSCRPTLAGGIIGLRRG